MPSMDGSSLSPGIVPFLSADEFLAGTIAAGTVVGGPAGIALQAASDLTAAQLRAIMPAARAANVARFLGPINQVFKIYGIDKSEQRAAFLAHVSVECKQLNAVVEELWYSARRLHVVWPRRFKTIKAAQPYEHNPEKLANHVYANRLKNGDEVSGDGWRYRGRGLIQITGRANYRKVGFEQNPEALEDPNTAADTAAAHWKREGLNDRTATLLTRAQFNGTTFTINGGQIGSNERWSAYRLALKALTLASQKSPAPWRPAR